MSSTTRRVCASSGIVVHGLASTFDTRQHTFRRFNHDNQDGVGCCIMTNPCTDLCDVGSADSASVNATCHFHSYTNILRIVRRGLLNLESQDSDHLIWPQNQDTDVRVSLQTAQPGRFNRYRIDFQAVPHGHMRKDGLQFKERYRRPCACHP